MRIAPRPKDGFEVKLEDLLKAPLVKPTDIDPKEFSVSMGPVSMTLTGIKILGRMYNVEVQNKLLGRNLGTSDFEKMARDQFNAGTFRPASTEEIYGILSTLVQKTQEYRTYDRQRLLLQNAIDKIKGAWGEFGPIQTFTYVWLNPGLKADEVIHLNGTAGEHKYFGQIAGLDCKLSGNPNPPYDLCEKLFGERDPGKVSEVFYETNGHSISIERHTSPTGTPIGGLVLIGHSTISICGFPSASPLGSYSLGIKTTEVI